MRIRSFTSLSITALAIPLLAACSSQPLNCERTTDELDQAFLVASKLLANSNHLKVVDVSGSASCTFEVTVKNSDTNQDSTMYMLPDMKHVVVGTLHKTEDGTGEPPLQKNSVAMSQATPEPKEAQNPPTTTNVETPSLAAIPGGHKKFYETLAEEKDDNAKKRMLFEHADQLEGVILHPEAQNTLLIFFDPFCEHCHKLYRAIKADNRFKQKWIPISIGLHEKGLELSSAIMTKPGSEFLNYVMDTGNHLDLNNLEISEQGRSHAENNTKFMLPILLEANAGTPFVFARSGGNEVNLFPGVPGQTDLNQWASYK